MREPEIDIHNTDMSGPLAQAQPDPVPPATEPPKVPTSVRLPLAAFERLKEVAAARGIGHTQLIEQYVLAGLAAEADAEQMVVPLAALQQVIAQITIRDPSLPEGRSRQRREHRAGTSGGPSAVAGDGHQSTGQRVGVPPGRQRRAM